MLLLFRVRYDPRDQECAEAILNRAFGALWLAEVPDIAMGGEDIRPIHPPDFRPIIDKDRDVFAPPVIGDRQHMVRGAALCHRDPYQGISGALVIQPDAM